MPRVYHRLCRENKSKTANRPNDLYRVKNGLIDIIFGNKLNLIPQNKSQSERELAFYSVRMYLLPARTEVYPEHPDPERKK